MAAEGRERVLKKPHDSTTWKYDRRPPLRFRASEAGNCARRIWYRLMGYVPAPDSPELMMKQMWGNLAQDVVRSLFKKYEIPIGGIEFKSDGTQKELLDDIKEFPVGEEMIKVSARADGEFNGDTLFEFKTIDHFKNYWFQQAYNGHWEKYGKGNDAVVARIKEKNPYYYDQVQITGEIFGKTRTLFGTQNRSAVEYGMKALDGTRADIYIERDPEQVLGILMKLAMIARAVRNEKVPPPLLAGSMECSFCPFLYQCHGKTENGGKVEYPDV
jgi:CRISPR/Cas system-associated exonuclease Cas4 (RecB family)